MIINDPKFNIGDEAYHVTKESPKGIIIDVEYKFNSNSFLYQVAFSFDASSMWYYGHELTKQMTY